MTGNGPPLTLAGYGHTQDDYRQLRRLERFRGEHPDVRISGGGRLPWQGLVPHRNGETVRTAYALRDLLDKLDDLFPDSG